MKVTKYRSTYLNLDLYKTFLDQDEIEKLSEATFNINYPYSYRRRNVNYGDEGLSYTLQISGQNPIVRTVIPWEEFLIDIRDKVKRVTNANYNYCVVQRYPNGKHGIKKHRDKEIKSGTKIAGLSLGEERVLTMGYRDTNVSIPLPIGSLYVLNPPTNDYWTHCIEKDETIKPRISLTFRLSC